MKIHENPYVFPTTIFSFPVFGVLWAFFASIVLQLIRIANVVFEVHITDVSAVLPLLGIGFAVTYTLKTFSSILESYQPSRQQLIGTLIAFVMVIILWPVIGTVAMDSSYERALSGFRIVYFGFWSSQFIIVARWFLANKRTNF